jgi:NAD+ diphosphatase
MERPFNHNAVFSSAFLQPFYPEPDEPPLDAEWVIVRGSGVFGKPGTPPAIFLTTTECAGIPPFLRSRYLGHRNGRACYAAEVAAESGIPGYDYFGNIRDLFGILPDRELAVAAVAVRIIDFDRTTRFCGQCGSETRQSREERAKVCSSCGRVTYPRISPAIIVLIRRDERVLLARSPRFPPGFHSVIAGFVGPDETLEEAVRREVREEVGIEVTNIRYAGSEPWPFPDSLMIGFVADYNGGEITIDNREIVSAGWFDREHLPDIPRQLSIARALINWWLGGGNPGDE